MSDDKHLANKLYYLHEDKEINFKDNLSLQNKNR